VLCETNSKGFLAGLALTNGYDQFLRRTNLALSSNSQLLSSSSFSYAPSSRLRTVADGANNSATYYYLANSPLVDHIVFAQNGTSRMTTTKQYDLLNRLTQISSEPLAGSAISFSYAYNSANQRTGVTNADNSYWAFGYDPLGQITSGKKHWSDNSLVAGEQFQYGFDTIGNRTSTDTGGDQNGNLHHATYAANNLNQYTSRDVPGFVDITGSANATNVSIWGPGGSYVIPYRKANYFWGELSVNNASAPVWASVTNLAVLPNGTNPATLGSVAGNLFVPQTPEHFFYDADGNLTNDGRWTYTWDAENRLVAITNRTPVGPAMGLSFAYDWRGRRIGKTVITNGLVSTSEGFVYDGWNLIAILTSNSSLLTSFTWGLDLSGTEQGAGGVGGLLAVSQLSNSRITNSSFTAYDGNGNTAALVDSGTGTTSGQYEYGPFGEVLRATGPMAKLNPFRFSTKYQDDETDLVYYGFRYEKDGRWISRDPIEEPGFDCLQGGTYGGDAGPNLYNFVANNPVSGIDLFGLKLGDMPGEHPFPPYPPNPSMLGKKCCGMSHCPAHLTGTRTDTAPTTSGGIFGVYTPWTLHLSVHINTDSDCYTDVRVDWMRCWGTGGAGYMGSGTSTDVSVSTVLGIGNVWLTEARINYLTCENGVWAKKLSKAGMSYRWTGTGWEFTVNGGSPTTTTPGS